MADCIALSAGCALFAFSASSQHLDSKLIVCERHEANRGLLAYLVACALTLEDCRLCPACQSSMVTAAPALSQDSAELGFDSCWLEEVGSSGSGGGGGGADSVLISVLLGMMRWRRS